MQVMKLGMENTGKVKFKKMMMIFQQLNLLQQR